MTDLPDTPNEGVPEYGEVETLDDAPEVSDSATPAPEALAESEGPPQWAVQMAEMLEEVKREASTFKDRARAQEDLIQRMQSRIEDLQADQVRSLLGPVVTELAGLHASLAEAASLDYERLGLERVAKEFGFLADRLEGSLELLDVVSVGARPGDPFDSRQHSAARRVPTADRTLDGTIAAVQRQGFRFARDSKTTLYARVTVFGYDASLEVESSAEPVQVIPVPSDWDGGADLGGYSVSPLDSTAPIDPSN